MASHIQSLSNFDNWNLPLRIHRKGNFFSDDGFLDFRSHFETAATDLLREFDLLRHEDSFKSYRRLRDRQMSGTDRTAKIAEEGDKYKIVMDVEGFSDADLQVKVSGPNEIVVEGRQETKTGGAFSQRSFKRRFSLPGLALVQDSTSVLSSDNVLTVTIPKKIQEITETKSDQTSSLLNKSREVKDITNTVQQSVQNTKEAFSSLFSDQKSSSNDDSFWDLQIEPKKSFFDDSFFENVRQNFQKSVDDMMENRIRRIDSVGDVGVFRKVRETKEENVQAISVTEDAKEHKIVLDVHGFSEGDLKVRAVSERELVVEGNVEKKTEYTSCTHTFRRNFTLPSSVNIKQASSALSSEGILTITVPKMVQSIDFPIPVRSEAASHIQSVLKHEQEKQSNLHREHTVPVQQEDITLSRQQTTQESTGCKTTTSDLSSYNISDSQNLLNKLERTVKLCEEIDNRSPPHVPTCLTERKVDKVQKEDSRVESSDIIRESQRLVDESAKLMQDLSSISSSTQKEHFVPVELDAGISLGTTGSTTTESQTKSTTKDISTSSRIIPISFKGSFYNDTIFEDARKSIDKEVENVFTKYRQTSVVADETKSEAEIAKSKDSSEIIKSGQTVSTILDDAHNYKIVLDVFGFEEKDLRVRVSGLNEITIEGSSEKSKSGSVSKHSFQRTFQLPDFVDLDRSFTALSEEGILTITIPKKNQLLLVQKKSVPFSTQIEREIKSKEIHPTLVVDSSGIVQDKRSETFQMQTDSQNTKREYIVPLSIEDTTETASVASNVQSASDLTSQMSTSSQTSTDLSQDILSSNTSCSSINTQVEKNLNSDKVIQVQNINVDKSSTDNQTREIITRPLFNLPIVSRGHFYDDSIFQDSRSMFETLLRNKMNRFNRSSSFVDDVSFFKCLRDNRTTEGSQLDTLSEDDLFNKIVLDVHGFNEDNLKIRALSDNEIVIEGSTEEKTGNSVSKKSFRKNFVLPGSVDLRGATSALSSDGVLNIKIPKRTV